MTQFKTYWTELNNYLWLGNKIFLLYLWPHFPNLSFNSRSCSKLNRKRSMAPSPMASTNGHGSSLEPSAKKVCARNTSCAVDESRLKNGNSTNGHSKASDNDVEDVTMAEDVSDAKVVETSPVTSRRGRPPRVTRQSSSKTDEDSSSEGRTPTRASARLRKSKKWDLKSPKIYALRDFQVLSVLLEERKQPFFCHFIQPSWLIHYDTKDCDSKRFPTFS